MNRFVMLAVLLPSLSLAGVSAASAAETSGKQPAIPPKAAQVTGPIQQVELGPVFAERYLCVEHALELEYAGDALGTDCVLSGKTEIGVDAYLKLYRSDGKTNADWYGWHADVLAPFDGTVIHVRHDTQENVPGTLGPPSATGSLRLKNQDGVIVVYAHLTRIAVKAGDIVKAGQAVAKLGNNGQTRAGYPYRRVPRVRRHAAADTLGPPGDGQDAGASGRSVIVVLAKPMKRVSALAIAAKRQACAGNGVDT